ncbi:MAG: hypothetical protein ABI217_00135 [Chthoniobacterales bacterium]
MNATETPEAPAELEKQFNWPVCYEAENLLFERIGTFLEQNSFARILSDRMRDETGTLFLDWIDHLVVSPADEAAFREAGLTDDPLGENRDDLEALWHPEAMLPRILLAKTEANVPPALAIRPEFVAEFAAAHDVMNKIEGEPFSRFRKLLVSEENGTQFYAIERRAYRGYVSQAPDLRKLCAARELWQTRRRRWDRDVKGYAYSLDRLQEVVDLVGPDLACHLVFEEERAFWQKRNRAAIEQKRRQDSLGLGWANRDHHTFRSSRKHFIDLMKAWEMLGFQRRERYYAGSQAGWGAQIVEQPIEGVTIFNDVDLFSDETAIDFSRKPLPPEEKKLRTVGLWVGLHGESFLDAGMHHLECRL